MPGCDGRRASRGAKGAPADDAPRLDSIFRAELLLLIPHTLQPLRLLLLQLPYMPPVLFPHTQQLLHELRLLLLLLFEFVTQALQLSLLLLLLLLLQSPQLPQVLLLLGVRIAQVLHLLVEGALPHRSEPGRFRRRCVAGDHGQCALKRRLREMGHIFMKRTVGGRAGGYCLFTCVNSLLRCQCLKCTR